MYENTDGAICKVHLQTSGKTSIGVICHCEASEATSRGKEFMYNFSLPCLASEQVKLSRKSHLLNEKTLMPPLACTCSRLHIQLDYQLGHGRLLARGTSRRFNIGGLWPPIEYQEGFH